MDFVIGLLSFRHQVVIYTYPSTTHNAKFSMLITSKQIYSSFFHSIGMLGKFRCIPKIDFNTISVGRGIKLYGNTYDQSKRQARKYFEGGWIRRVNNYT
jgi:hypothetical protein